MTDQTFDVRIWKVRVRKGAKKTSYGVRWVVAGVEWNDSFATDALADAFRSGLVTAARKGEAFSTETGRPVSWLSKAATTNWYAFAVEFADAKWSCTSANNRKNVAKALTAATAALLRRPPKEFDPVLFRRALREYGFNKRRREDAPDDVREVLAWVQRNSLPMTAWENSEKVDEILAAVGTLLNGKPASASSVKRYRRILNVAIQAAVRKGVLTVNPLPKGKGTSPKTSTTVDKRSLINPDQAAALLGWVRGRPRTGRTLHAFYATMLFAGARPEEVVAMDAGDVTLPEADAGNQWGELLLHTATPEVGRHWTDSGEIHDDRDLKGRAQGETRPVPCHPVLTAILREHIASNDLKPGALLFQGEKGGRLAGSVFRRAWGKARHAVLTPHQAASPLGKRVYDLRHTCLTTWLNEGVPPAQVAEWAGNSVPVLLSTYARCLSGQLRDLQRRLDGVHDAGAFLAGL